MVRFQRKEEGGEEQGIDDSMLGETCRGQVTLYILEIMIKDVMPAYEIGSFEESDKAGMRSRVKRTAVMLDSTDVKYPATIRFHFGIYECDRPQAHFTTPRLVWFGNTGIDCVLRYLRQLPVLSCICLTSIHTISTCPRTGDLFILFAFINASFDMSSNLQKFLNIIFLHKILPE